MNVSAFRAGSPSIIGPNTAGSGGSSAGGTDGLGKNDFLKLLLAQLQNQDPMKPMEDRDFIVQLAQFRSLEEMENLNTGMMAMLDMQQTTQAAALIGKTVEANAGTGEPPIVGVVSEIDLSDGAAALIVDGKRVYLHDVIRVR